jgi:glutamine---fructose-6-phosphate transaminase (isomerizing)
VLDTLFNGLKRLEYRGYDSAGIAVELVDTYANRRSDEGSEDSIPEENGSYAGSVPLICKEVGKVGKWPPWCMATVVLSSELTCLIYNRLVR